MFYFEKGRRRYKGREVKAGVSSSLLPVPRVMYRTRTRTPWCDGATLLRSGGVFGSKEDSLHSWTWTSNLCPRPDRRSRRHRYHAKSSPNPPHDDPPTHRKVIRRFMRRSTSVRRRLTKSRSYYSL